MKNNPKISIIVPVYNVEKYLSCCMDSLSNQTLKDIEIILVDDESSDHCPAMCDEYANQDHRIRVIHKKNGGLGYARNSGLEIAKGEYIAFVDSDDYVASNTYQKLYDLANDAKADVIYFYFQRFNEKGNTWMESGIRKEIWYQTEKDIRGLMLDMIANCPKSKFDRNIEVSSCCALYRNDLIKKYDLVFKSERELISEDLLFNLDYLLHSANVMTIPDALYFYRENISSLSRAIRPDRISKNHFFYQYLLEKLKTNNFEIEGYLRSTRLFIANSRVSIRQYVQSSFSKKEKMQWLKSIVKNPVWKEIASSYPYQQLPFKYALFFFLILKRFYRLLYYYSSLKYKSKY